MTEQPKMTVEAEIVFDKLISSKKKQRKNILAMNRYFDDFQMSMDKMQELEYNTSYRTIEGRGGRVMRAVKKMLRKLSFFYVEPVCQQQSYYNNAVTLSCISIHKICTSLSRQNQTLLEKQEDMQKNYERMQDSFEEKIRELEEKIQKLEGNS